MNINCKKLNYDAKTFRPNGKPHYRISVSLDLDDVEKENIHAVSYHMHPTFKERELFSRNACSNFEVQFWTYGWFDIKAELFLKDTPEPKYVLGKVEW